MQYSGVKPLTRKDAVGEIESDEESRVVEGLLSLAFFDRSPEFVLDHCEHALKDKRRGVRGIAVLCVGHLVRLHGDFEPERTRRLVREAANDTDEWVRGKAEDAQEDIEMYC